MNIAQNIINNINEKASIDWNNYLTPEEVDKFLSKDDKAESAEEIIYNTKGNFYNKYYDNFKEEGWTKRELTQDLSNFYYNDNLNEDSFELWKSQIDKKEELELRAYLDKLLKALQEYNDYDTDIKSDNYYNLLKKLDYVENRLGTKANLGRVLH